MIAKTETQMGPKPQGARRPRLRGGVGACIVLLLLVGCAGPPSQPVAPTHPAPVPPSFDRKAMLTDITTQVIVPAHERLVETAQVLETSLTAFDANPTPETLTAAQDAWRTTMTAWGGVELYNLGAVKDARLSTAIDKWPVKISFVEDFIAGQDVLDEPFIESIGATSKGLAAVEYLLFGVEGDSGQVLQQMTEGPTPARRRAYLVALGANLHQKAKMLLALWTEAPTNYAADFINADSDGGELQSSISMLTNSMVELLERVAQMQLGKAVGRTTYGAPNPKAVEISASDYALPTIIANIESFQQAFSGGAGQGLDAYLDFVGATHGDQPLSQAINVQTEASLAALRGIEGPLEEAVVENQEQVLVAYNAVKELLVLIKVDMANQLGITITFTDNDGD